VRATAAPGGAVVGVVPLQGGAAVEGLALERGVEVRRVDGQALEGIAALPVVLLQGEMSWGISLRMVRMQQAGQRSRARPKTAVHMSGIVGRITRPAAGAVLRQLQLALEMHH
jgi:hypothetical protein